MKGIAGILVGLMTVTAAAMAMASGTNARYRSGAACAGSD
jgi:hypothetical protein